MILCVTSSADACLTSATTLNVTGAPTVAPGRRHHLEVHSERSRRCTTYRCRCALPQTKWDATQPGVPTELTVGVGLAWLRWHRPQRSGSLLRSRTCPPGSPSRASKAGWVHSSDRPVRCAKNAYAMRNRPQRDVQPTDQQVEALVSLVQESWTTSRASSTLRPRPSSCCTTGDHLGAFAGATCPVDLDAWVAARQTWAPRLQSVGGPRPLPRPVNY